MIACGLLILAGFLLARAYKVSRAEVKIPSHINDKLLFTPYVPAQLPKDFEIDQDSFVMQETALLFTATHKDTNKKIVFSEQGVPKGIDIEAFYSASVPNPTRLEGLRYKTLYGQLQGKKESLASIVTSDDTWILVTLPESVAKADIRTIENSLVSQ